MVRTPKKQHSSPPTRRQKFAALSIAELLAQPPQEWLVRDLVPRQGVVLLASAPNVGKTSLALDLCLSVVADRQAWCGCRLHGGRARTVAYVALEGRQGLPARIRAWVRHHAGELIGAGLQVWSPTEHHSGVLLDYRAQQLVDALTATMPCLVVVDTFAMACAGTENDADGVADALRALRAISEQIQCAVLVLHHIRKAPHQQGERRAPGLDDVRGSSAIAGACDAVLTLSEDQHGLVLHVAKARDARRHAPIGLALQVIATGAVLADGSPEHGAVMVPRVLPDALEARARYDADARRRLAAVASTEPVSRDALAALAGLRPALVRHLVDDLVRDGVLQVVPVRGGARYRITTSSPPKGGDGVRTVPQGMPSSSGSNLSELP